MFNSIKYNESLHVTLSKWFGLATVELDANLIFPHRTFKVDLFDHNPSHHYTCGRMYIKNVPFRFATRVVWYWHCSPSISTSTSKISHLSGLMLLPSNQQE